MKPFDLLFQGQSALAPVRQSPMVDFLLLRFGDRTYGVSISQLSEIIRFGAPTLVPRTPASILGVISHRGQVLSIIDVRQRLGIEPVPPSSSSRVVVTRDRHDDLTGVYVDEVLRVARVRDDQVESAENALGSEASDHVQGIVRTSNITFVALLLAPLLD